MNNGWIAHAHSRAVATGRTLVAMSALWLVCAQLGGCGFSHDITIDGPYHLIAVDTDGQMSVCYILSEGCIGRIPATVYAVGVDATYVVAARHPAGNRSLIEYYYVIRAADGPIVDTSVAVRGPFDQKAYDAARVELHLPALTYEIARLK